MLKCRVIIKARLHWAFLERDCDWKIPIAYSLTEEVDQ